MKKVSILFFIVVFIFCCSKRRNTPLIDKVENFKISECQNNCGIDSVGVRKNEIIDNILRLKIGQIVNCAWEDGFLQKIEFRKDTLLIGLDRSADLDTLSIDTTMVKGEEVISLEIVKTYPIYDCDCFFYFELNISDVQRKPKFIRLHEGDGLSEKDYWDDLP